MESLSNSPTSSPGLPHLDSEEKLQHLGNNDSGEAVDDSNLSNDSTDEKLIKEQRNTFEAQAVQRNALAKFSKGYGNVKVLLPLSNVLSGANLTINKSILGIHGVYFTESFEGKFIAKLFLCDADVSTVVAADHFLKFMGFNTPNSQALELDSIQGQKLKEKFTQKFDPDGSLKAKYDDEVKNPKRGRKLSKDLLMHYVFDKTSSVICMDHLEATSWVHLPLDRKLECLNDANFCRDLGRTVFFDVVMMGASGEDRLIDKNNCNPGNFMVQESNEPRLFLIDNDFKTDSNSMKARIKLLGELLTTLDKPISLLHQKLNGLLYCKECAVPLDFGLCPQGDVESMMDWVKRMGPQANVVKNSIFQNMKEGVAIAAQQFVESFDTEDKIQLFLEELSDHSCINTTSIKSLVDFIKETQKL